MKRLLLLTALLVFVLPGTANAAGTPCKDKVVSDWYRDGKIASTYPIGCYRAALKHIPADAEIYSSLRDDVNAAMRAAARRSKGLSAPLEVGHGAKATGAGYVKGALVSIDASKKVQAQPSSTGVVASASGAPLPILILGGIALALAAAGAIGVGVRHARGRRPR